MSTHGHISRTAIGEDVGTLGRWGEPPLSLDGRLSPPPAQPGWLMSHLSTAAQLMARVRDAESEPSSLTFMFLIVGSSSELSPLCLLCSH